jgi:UDP-glucose 4-epimerase
VKTTLQELAELAADLGPCPTQISLATPRTFDIQEFYGDPRRASEVLGWRTAVALRTGLGKLIEEFKGCPPTHLRTAAARIA